MSCLVQGKLCYLFLPFTDEGESFRWNMTISSDQPSLSIERADKLCNKKASEQFLSKMLSTQIHKILGKDGGTSAVNLHDSARACIAHMERASKSCLKSWVGQKGHTNPVPKTRCTLTCAARWIRPTSITSSPRGV